MTWPAAAVGARVDRLLDVAWRPRRASARRGRHATSRSRATRAPTAAAGHVIDSTPRRGARAAEPVRRFQPPSDAEERSARVEARGRVRREAGYPGEQVDGVAEVAV